MSRGRVYLAGPVTRLTMAEALDWRERVSRRLADSEIEAIIPLRGEVYLSRFAGRAITADPGDYPHSAAKAITRRDRWDCRRADIVLVNLVGAEHVSIGSVMEIAWAKGPVVLAMEPGNPHEHLMVLETASHVLPSLDEAVETVIELLGG